MSEKVRSIKDMKRLSKNRIIGEILLDDSVIEFQGEGNTLIALPPAGRGVASEWNTTLRSASIKFLGNQSIVMLAPSKWAYCIDVRIFSECSLCCGDNFFNPRGGAMSFTVGEHSNVLMGSGGRVASRVQLVTSDQHPLYDMTSMTRINPSRSVLVGDKVWLGKDSLIMKGTQLGTGSTVAARALVAGKRVPSYSLWGGVPAQQLREHVFSLGLYVDSLTPQETERVATQDSNYVFSKFHEQRTLNFDEVDGQIRSLTDIDEKISFLMQFFDRGAIDRWFI
ncbi:MAG: hypothetical protein FWF43_00320 [Propionibacteriaceae bacterium]|nr:hypothetical protein [Propionibacteriaceae bacterium]